MGASSDRGRGKELFIGDEEGVVPFCIRKGGTGCEGDAIFAAAR